MKATIYTSDDGKVFEIRDIPADMLDLAAEYREKLIESISDFDDTIMERFLDGEERPRFEVPDPRNHTRRELLDQRVQTRHLVVVELPGVSDLRLGAGQFLLQRQEVLVGLEIGVVLGYGDQVTEPGGDGVFGLRLILHPLRAHRLSPSLGHVFEDLAFVRGVALHRFDEIRDQVVAATQLDVDLGPAIVDARPERDQPVEREHAPQQEDHAHTQQDPNDRHRSLS